MQILAVESITKSYGPHTILNGVSLGLQSGQRLGLTGANGVGKSTLLRIIIGHIPADSGGITLAPGLHLGYHAQTPPTATGHTLSQMIAQSQARVVALEQQMRALESTMTTAEGHALEAALTAYGQVTEQFERYGGYDMAWQVDTVLNGLGVGHLPRQQPFDTLSGGEKARVGLAMLLLQSPDALLLDEPTNHLDFASIAWLETYLQAYRGAVLMVAHDRYFLNRTVNAIVEIEEHSRQSRYYSGNYDAFLRMKAQQRRKWIDDYAQQREEIKLLRQEVRTVAQANSNYRAHTDSDKFMRNAKKATHDKTVSKRVQAAEEKLRRLEANLIPAPPKELRFRAGFDPQALQGRQPLYAAHMCKAYGARVLLDDISFTLGVDSRVVIVGPNGAGKSTLLQILAGEIQPDAGEVHRSAGITLGYLSQTDTGSHDERTLLQAFGAGQEGTQQQHAATLIQLGLFRYEELDKQVNQLSSGQRRKLQLARLITQGANLLLLDEPTNYLSLDVLEELEAALHDFPGPILAATHDRRFMEQFGREVWELRDGHIINHVGGYEGYISQQAARTGAKP